MKYVETLGHYHLANRKGIFRYARTNKGVWIDPTVVKSATMQKAVTVPHSEWNNLLNALWSGNATFNIQGESSSLTSLILQELSSLGQSPNLANYVVAILEHEGTIDHYGGIRGPKEKPAKITLRTHREPNPEDDEVEDEPSANPTDNAVKAILG